MFPLIKGSYRPNDCVFGLERQVFVEGLKVYDM